MCAPLSLPTRDASVSSLLTTLTSHSTRFGLKLHAVSSLLTTLTFHSRRFGLTLLAVSSLLTNPLSHISDIFPISSPLWHRLLKHYWINPHIPVIHYSSSTVQSTLQHPSSALELRGRPPPSQPLRLRLLVSPWLIPVSHNDSFLPIPHDYDSPWPTPTLIIHVLTIGLLLDGTSQHSKPEWSGAGCE